MRVGSCDDGHCREDPRRPPRTPEDDEGMLPPAFTADIDKGAAVLGCGARGSSIIYFIYIHGVHNVQKKSPSRSCFSFSLTVPT